MSFIRSSELKTGKIKIKPIYDWEKGGNGAGSPAVNTSSSTMNASLTNQSISHITNATPQLENSEVTLHFKMSPMDFSKLQQKRGMGKDLSITGFEFFFFSFVWFFLP